MNTVLADEFPSLVDGVFSQGGEFFRHVIFERFEHSLKDVARPRLAKFRTVGRHEGLGGQEVRVHQAGEKKAEHECHSVISRIGTGERRIRNGTRERNARILSMGTPFIDLLPEALLKEIRRIGQSGMMTSDEIAQKIAKWWERMRESGSRGGMVFLPRRAAFAFGGMCIGFGSKVSLPFRRELSQIMPKPREVSPLTGGVAIWTGRKHFGGELGRPPSDLVEMAVLRVERIASGAMVSLQRRTIRREEGLPFFWALVFQRMGVEVHGEIPGWGRKGRRWRDGREERNGIAAHGGKVPQGVGQIRSQA